MDAIIFIVELILLFGAGVLVFDSSFVLKEKIVGLVCYVGMMAMFFILLINLSVLFNTDAALLMEDKWVMVQSEVHEANGESTKVDTYVKKCEVVVSYIVPYTVQTYEPTVLTYDSQCGKLTPSQVAEYTEMLNRKG